MGRRKRCKAKLRLYPDPILKAVCEPVGDDEDVSGIIRDMMHILTNSKTGVGLAAPQAGHKKRIIIINDRGDRHIMINPKILATCQETDIRAEACLSYPGKQRYIRRPVSVDVGWELVQSRQWGNGIFTKLVARIIQHEIDHLDGQCKVGEI